jgi:hypothetical protein
MKGILLILLLFLAGCAGIADGQVERLYNVKYNNELTQIPEKQDYRTFRQQLPDFLLP